MRSINTYTLRSMRIRLLSWLVDWLEVIDARRSKGAGNVASVYRGWSIQRSVGRFTLELFLRPEQWFTLRKVSLICGCSALHLGPVTLYVEGKPCARERKQREQEGNGTPGL